MDNERRNRINLNLNRIHSEFCIVDRIAYVENSKLNKLLLKSLLTWRSLFHVKNDHIYRINRVGDTEMNEWTTKPSHSFINYLLKIIFHTIRAAALIIYFYCIFADARCANNERNLHTDIQIYWWRIRCLHVWILFS